VTLAGSLAVGHAEVLAGIVLNQVLEPGRPVVYNLGFAHILDMRTASAVTGGAEVCLMAVAAAKLAELHGLPSASWMCTDAMIPDAQAAAETMMAALAHSAGGVGLIWGVGQIESQKTLSPVKAVIDDEIVGMARRFARGCETTPEAIAEDLIRSAGIGGEFLSTEHTMNHFQGEFYEPKLLCRVSREQWDAAGRRDLADRARERAESILAADRPPLLDEAATNELRRIEQSFLSQLD
jgi:trimethylamine--corrinoid protein Co-methyltransferase